MEHVADTDFAGGLGGEVVRGDAVEFASFCGLLAGLEEAGGPEPFVDAGAGHACIFYFGCRFGKRLNRAEHTAGKREERGNEFEGAAYGDADEAEGQQDEPDQRIEDEGREGQGPAKESE